MARYEPIGYQGPERNFIPEKGDIRGVAENSPLTSVVGDNSYADLDYLIGLLDQLIADANNIYSNCDDKLREYALFIDQDNIELNQAQKIAYPGTEAPSIITFEQYKYNLTNNSNNATQYIISTYEDSLRGIGGTNALDVSFISRIISNEAKRIKVFIENYIGDLDDSSEFRAVELFQDWAEESSVALKRFREALTAKIPHTLAESELDQLTQETAPQLQALFQVKLNVINKSIKDMISQISKNWENTSSFFYNKNLGPALQFQLKVGRSIQSNINLNAMPVLGNEAYATIAGLNANYSVALADQSKRNQIFTQCCKSVFLNIIERGRYIEYINQLSFLGKEIKAPFTTSNSIEQPAIIINSTHPLSVTDDSVDVNTNFDHLHSELTGLDDDAAHSQYLLRSGGSDSVLTGDIHMAEGVRIDGIIPSTHVHTGQDGSQKIRGSDIDYNSITEENINTIDPTTSIPENLTLVTQSAALIPPGLVKVTAKISFDVTTSSNITGYEFEVIKL